MSLLPSPTHHMEARIEGSIGWLVLNHPARRNALNAAMWAAIPKLIADLAASHNTHAIIIRGAGHEAFAAGADISEFATERHDATAAAAYEALNGAALAAIRACPKPVIAMIQGFCIGGGLAIALACDLRLADASATFSLPPARLGLAYPLDGLKDLVATVGPATAKELLFTARRLKADEALRIGLINHHADELEPDIRALCAEIAAGAPHTLVHAKRAIDLIAGRPGHVSEAEIETLATRCFNSADYAEGRAAFAQKRKPVFRGT